MRRGLGVILASMVLALAASTASVWAQGKIAKAVAGEHGDVKWQEFSDASGIAEQARIVSQRR